MPKYISTALRASLLLAVAIAYEVSCALLTEAYLQKGLTKAEIEKSWRGSAQYHVGMPGRYATYYFLGK